MKDLFKEGAEIIYTDPFKFDMWGPGTVQGIEMQHLAEPMVKILFESSTTIDSQFLSLSNFQEKIKKKEIESAEGRQEMIWERDLVRNPQQEELEALSQQELLKLLPLLKSRVEDEGRLWREEAVLLIRTLIELELIEEEIVRELFEFLLGQTKTRIKRRRAPHLSSYSLHTRAQFRQEQLGVMAQCLECCAKVAQKREDEEMRLAVRKAANRLQTHSSQILKRAAKSVLKT